MKNLLVLVGLYSTAISANPYFDPTAVPKEKIDLAKIQRSADAAEIIPLQRARAEGLPVLRVLIGWEQKDGKEVYSLNEAVLETSGTEALYARSQHVDPHGSYKAILRENHSGTVIGHAAIGTGSAFRLLTRALSFRFPAPKTDAVLEVYGENPKSGSHELILKKQVPLSSLQGVGDDRQDLAVEVKTFQEASQNPALILNIYAEGYKANRKDVFWQHAARVLEGLKSVKFPLMERLTIRAVFAPSKQSLGSARNLGLPVKRYDSFLGLFFPYWNNFGRWYHVVYPTDEGYFRENLAAVPYDHPIVLIDDNKFWGVGNFNELTAIPGANTDSFNYLLVHELGHYFGLNEEYEGGGATELAFAPEISEPWSQNITFLPRNQQLKWQKYVLDRTPIPTPSNLWTGQGPFGAYKGGYADSLPRNQSHKPGMACVMERNRQFCPICDAALKHRLRFDLGE